jgi:hypothetical protein
MCCCKTLRLGSTVLFVYLESSTANAAGKVTSLMTRASYSGTEITHDFAECTSIPRP